MKLLAIDGNSIVNRAFFGIRMLNAPDGTPTNAIYGFLAILRRLLDEEKPDGVIVAFDLKAPTFRHLRYAGYKAQRKGMPEDLAAQMPLLKDVLDAMNVSRVELEGFEADDLLGTLSRQSEVRGDECVIVTGDRDAFQLITDHTRVKHIKTRAGQTETIDYTRARFEEEYGFAPIHMIDLKALMGDASDNIPGVPGVGEKTAMDLIRRYESVDAIYAGLAGLDVRDSVRKKLEAGADMARLSYELAAIDTGAPVELDLSETRWSGEYKPELYALFLRLGFHTFIEKYALRPVAAEAAPAPAGDFTGECESEFLTDMAGVRAAAEKMVGRTAYVSCGDALEYAVLHYDETEGRAHAFFLDKTGFEGDYAEALRLLFAPELKKAGHDVKDLQRALLEYGAAAEGWVFDSALAAYLLDATAGSYELSRLCEKYCGFTPYRAQAGEGGQLSMLETDSSGAEAWSERAGLAAAVACLHGKLDALLIEKGMDRLYYEIELPLCAVLAEMERSGVYIDRAALAEFGEGMTGAIAALQRNIWNKAGGEFNILSPKQLGSVLFERLLLPAGKKTKTGWSTNADTLEGLRGKHPIVDEVLKYRELTKLKSTYCDGLLKVIGPGERIHTRFMMTVTDTGRLSSREPNLQNIPIRREFGGQIRKMFTAPEGRLLVDADYSQIELRLLAHISGDENMIAAFQSGEDIHAVTASQVFGVPLEQVTRLQRSHAKAVNFGIVYGISAWSLAQDIGVTSAEARSYMDAYLAKYHGVREYQKEVVARAKADGYVSTLYGRRRALPEIKSGNFAQRSFGERVALNMPIQGTAADVIKLAMTAVRDRLRREGLQARLVLQVHDELIAECPEDEAETVKAILIGEMERAASLSVPLVADAQIGRSWAEAH